jgi:hypothetical protein
MEPARERKTKQPKKTAPKPSSRSLRAGKVKPADPFELIRWLAHCQQDPRKAVAELVQNSLDAGARTVDLIRRREKGVNVLAIADDGSGVIPELPREEALAYIATHIGHSRKRSLTPEQRRELMTQGQYGIGLLGFWCIGKHLVMRSTVGGEPACELHLHAEDPHYEVLKSRGRLLTATGTEVLVRDIKPEVIRLLTARKLSDYLAMELRGQIMERGVRITIHDKIARGLAQKVFAVKPTQFPGTRIAQATELQVPGHRPARLELYVVAASDTHLNVALAAAGTIVVEDLTRLDPEWFTGTALSSGRICGVIDFPDLEVSPGARRGVAAGPAVDALLLALGDLLPILEAQLCAEDQRRLQDVEQRQLKRLRRAFLAVRKRAPEFEFFDVSAGHGKGQEPPAVADATEPPAGQALGEQPVQAGATESNNGDVGHDVDVDVDVDADRDAHEPRSLFAPGPLDRLEIRPVRTRVEILGRRKLRALPLDADGRRVPLSVAVDWHVGSGPGSLERLGTDGSSVVFAAGEDEGVTELQATATDGNIIVEASATVETVLGMGDHLDALGIPTPAFVDDPAGSWRSRLRGGTWEVNRSHNDFQEASQNDRRQLRYLSSLLAKEVVLRSFFTPQSERPLEQMVRLLTILDSSLQA